MWVMNSPIDRHSWARRSGDSAVSLARDWSAALSVLAWMSSDVTGGLLLRAMKPFIAIIAALLSGAQFGVLAGETHIEPSVHVDGDAPGAKDGTMATLIRVEPRLFGGCSGGDDASKQDNHVAQGEAPGICPR